MKVVIDTNILISAVFRDREPQEVILFLVEHDEFEWVVSTDGYHNHIFDIVQKTGL